MCLYFSPEVTLLLRSLLAAAYRPLLFGGVQNNDQTCSLAEIMTLTTYFCRNGDELSVSLRFILTY